MQKESESDGGPLVDTPQAVITISVHEKLPWGPSYVFRASQHALLSSQTLGDLFEVIPCRSNEFSEESAHGNVTVYKEEDIVSNTGSVICIEGFAYGDGQSESDYAEYVPLAPVSIQSDSFISSKLLSHTGKIAKSPMNIKKAEMTMHETTLASLSLRTHEPYWLLHQGNCEHFIVVDEIRRDYFLNLLTAVFSLLVIAGCSTLLTLVPDIH